MGDTCYCCREIFPFEGGIGGYIDHVTNFSNQFNDMSQYSIDHIVERVARDDNDPRYAWDIKKRLACFLESDAFSKGQKREVAKRVEKLIERSERSYNKAEKIYQSLTRDEMFFLRELL